MNATINAETYVLDRIIHLLQEESVGHLIEQDAHFAQFIERLYETVDTKSEALRQEKHQPDISLQMT